MILFAAVEDNNSNIWKGGCNVCVYIATVLNVLMELIVLAEAARSHMDIWFLSGDTDSWVGEFQWSRLDLFVKLKSLKPVRALCVCLCVCALARVHVCVPVRSVI